VREKPCKLDGRKRRRKTSRTIHAEQRVLRNLGVNWPVAESTTYYFGVRRKAWVAPLVTPQPTI